MKNVFSIACGLLFTCLGAGAVSAQNTPGACEVYLVDRQEAGKVFEALTEAATPEEAEEKMKAAVKVLGSFTREPGEEVLTSRAFPIPHSRLVATAGVMYTDEFEERMLLGLSVSGAAAKNPLDGPESAVAEVSYEEKPFSLRVRKFVEIGGRPFTVGVFCQFNEKGDSR